MNQLVMIVNKHGRFVGKTVQAGDNAYALEDAVEVIQMAGPEGSMLGGAILGAIDFMEVDMRVYLDEDSSPAKVYRDATSSIIVSDTEIIQ